MDWNHERSKTGLLSSLTITGASAGSKEQEARCLVPDYRSPASLSAFECSESAAPQIITAVPEDGLKCEASRLGGGGPGSPENRPSRGKGVGAGVWPWQDPSTTILHPSTWAGLSQVLAISQSPEWKPQL